MRSGGDCRTDMWSANRCRSSRGLRLMRAFDTNALQFEPYLVGQPRRLPAGEAPALQRFQDGDCALVPALKTSGPIDSGKSARNRRVVDRNLCGANCSDRHRGVLFLKMTTQRDWRTVVRFSYKLQWRFALGGACANHLLSLGSLRGANNRNSGLDDSRLFTGDFSKRVSQPFFMI